MDVGRFLFFVTGVLEAVWCFWGVSRKKNVLKPLLMLDEYDTFQTSINKLKQ